MATNGNGQFVRTIFWTLILGSFAWTTAVLWVSAKSISANEKECVRNNSELEQRVCTKIDRNQENLRSDISLIKNEVTLVKENQATIIARQNMVIDTLKELKQDIKKIQ